MNNLLNSVSVYILILTLSSVVVLLISIILIDKQLDKILRPKTTMGNLMGILFEKAFKVKCQRKLNRIRNTPKAKRRSYYNGLEIILKENIKDL